jgi:hypothetical protein
VLFAGAIAPRAPEAAVPVAPPRPSSQPALGAPGDRPAGTSGPVGGGCPEAAAAPQPAPGFHGAVSAFKRRLIETTLTELGGNRTRAARALGLQRTYLLRLMREFAVHVPAGPVSPRRAGNPPGAAVPPPR